jgi:hypothetical protein
VDDFPKGIIDIEDIVLYPSFTVEHPEVVLGGDQPLPSIEEELIPQGRAKDAAAHNANLQLVDVARVAAAPIVHTNADKLNNHKIDGNDGLIAVGDISQQPPYAPLVVNNTDDNNNAAGSGDDDNDEDVNDNEDDNKPAAATDALKGNQSDSDKGKQRLQRRGKDNTKKNADYSLLTAARRARREGQCRTLICDGCVFFLSDNLSDAKPIPEEDREEFALGVTLVHYSMNTGIKKFKAKGGAVA